MHKTHSVKISKNKATLTRVNKNYKKKKKQAYIIAQEMKKSKSESNTSDNKKVEKLSLKDKDSNKKFKPIFEVKKPEDYSANWKMLKELITKGDRKRPKSEKRKTISSSSKQEEVKEQTKQPESTSSNEAEIWFDNVDPTLLEDGQHSAKRRKVETPEVNVVKIDLSKNIPQKQILQKEHAFKGPTKVVALDCEMVGGGYQGKENILARVSLVNQYGNPIYDKFVKPDDHVVDYRTKVSGVRKTDLVNAESSFSTVQKEVFDLIKDRILVGHALKNDLNCLLLSHPKHMIRDTSRYKPFIKLVGGRPSLKKLAANILGVEIQTGEHSSVQDAQAAMQLYILNRKEWEEKVWRKQGSTKNRKKKSSNENSNDK